MARCQSEIDIEGGVFYAVHEVKQQGMRQAEKAFLAVSLVPFVIARAWDAIAFAFHSGASISKAALCMKFSIWVCEVDTAAGRTGAHRNWLRMTVFSPDV